MALLRGGLRCLGDPRGVPAVGSGAEGEQVGTGGSGPTFGTQRSPPPRCFNHIFNSNLLLFDPPGVAAGRVGGYF